jgi:hypothetical protein
MVLVITCQHPDAAAQAVIGTQLFGERLMAHTFCAFCSVVVCAALGCYSCYYGVMVA